MNGRFKPITDFDWGWPKNIERDVIERALTLDFIQWIVCHHDTTHARDVEHLIDVFGQSLRVEERARFI